MAVFKLIFSGVDMEGRSSCNHWQRRTMIVFKALTERIVVGLGEVAMVKEDGYRGDAVVLK